LCKEYQIVSHNLVSYFYHQIHFILPVQLPYNEKELLLRIAAGDEAAYKIFLPTIGTRFTPQH
jgi:hypothetical protein